MLLYQIVTFTYTWKNIKKSYKIMNLKCQLRYEMNSMNYLIDHTQQTFVLMKTWSRRISLTTSRRLEDVLVKTNIFVVAICLQDVFKTFSRRLQDVFKTFWRRLQDIFKTSCKDIFKTFSRRTIRLNCLPRSHLWEIYGQCRKFVSVLKFIKFYHNSMVLVFHFTGT